MHVDGVEILTATREQVLSGLSAPELLTQAIPGCESIARLDNESYALIGHIQRRSGRMRYRGFFAIKEGVSPGHLHVEAVISAPFVHARATGELHLSKWRGGTRIAYAVSLTAKGLGGQYILRTLREDPEGLLKKFMARLDRAVLENDPSAAPCPGRATIETSG